MRPRRRTRAPQRMTLAPEVVPGSARAAVKSQHKKHPLGVHIRHEQPHVAVHTAMAWWSKCAAASLQLVGQDEQSVIAATRCMPMSCRAVDSLVYGEALAPDNAPTACRQQRMHSLP